MHVKIGDESYISEFVVPGHVVIWLGNLLRQLSQSPYLEESDHCKQKAIVKLWNLQLRNIQV